MIFSIWYCTLFNYWIFIWCNRTRFSINYEPTALQKWLPLVSIVRFDLHSTSEKKNSERNTNENKTKNQMQNIPVEMTENDSLYCGKKCNISGRSRMVKMEYNDKGDFLEECFQHANASKTWPENGKRNRSENGSKEKRIHGKQQVRVFGWKISIVVYSVRIWVRMCLCTKYTVRTTKMWYKETSPT